MPKCLAQYWINDQRPTMQSVMGAKNWKQNKKVVQGH